MKWTALFFIGVTVISVSADIPSSNHPPSSFPASHKDGSLNRLNNFQNPFSSSSSSFPKHHLPFQELTNPPPRPVLGSFDSSPSTDSTDDSITDTHPKQQIWNSLPGSHVHPSTFHDTNLFSNTGISNTDIRHDQSMDDGEMNRQFNLRHSNSNNKNDQNQMISSSNQPLDSSLLISNSHSQHNHHLPLQQNFNNMNGNETNDDQNGWLTADPDPISSKSTSSSSSSSFRNNNDESSIEFHPDLNVSTDIRHPQKVQFNTTNVNFTKAATDSRKNGVIDAEFNRDLNRSRNNTEKEDFITDDPFFSLNNSTFNDNLNNMNSTSMDDQDIDGSSDSNDSENLTDLIDGSVDSDSVHSIIPPDLQASVDSDSTTSTPDSSSPSSSSSTSTDHTSSITSPSNNHDQVESSSSTSGSSISSSSSGSPSSSLSSTNSENPSSMPSSPNEQVSSTSSSSTTNSNPGNGITGHASSSNSQSSGNTNGVSASSQNNGNGISNSNSNSLSSSNNNNNDNSATQSTSTSTADSATGKQSSSSSFSSSSSSSSTGNSNSISSHQILNGDFNKSVSGSPGSSSINNSTSLSIGSIVGIVFGVLFGIGLLTFGASKIKTKRDILSKSSNSYYSPNNNGYHGHDNNNNNNSYSADLENGNSRHYSSTCMKLPSPPKFSPLTSPFTSLPFNLSYESTIQPSNPPVLQQHQQQFNQDEKNSRISIISNVESISSKSVTSISTDITCATNAMFKTNSTSNDNNTITTPPLHRPPPSSTRRKSTLATWQHKFRHTSVADSTLSQSTTILTKSNSKFTSKPLLKIDTSPFTLNPLSNISTTHESQHLNSILASKWRRYSSSDMITTHTAISTLPNMNTTSMIVSATVIMNEYNYDNSPKILAPTPIRPYTAIALESLSNQYRDHDHDHGSWMNQNNSCINHESIKPINRISQITDINPSTSSQKHHEYRNDHDENRESKGFIYSKLKAMFQNEKRGSDALTLAETERMSVLFV